MIFLSSHQTVTEVPRSPQHRGSCSGCNSSISFSNPSRIKRWGTSHFLEAATELLGGVWHQMVWAIAEKLPTPPQQGLPWVLGTHARTLRVSSSPAPEEDLAQRHISLSSSALTDFKENILGWTNVFQRTLLSSENF